MATKRKKVQAFLKQGRHGIEVNSFLNRTRPLGHGSYLVNHVIQRKVKGQAYPDLLDKV